MRAVRISLARQEVHIQPPAGLGAEVGTPQSWRGLQAWLVRQSCEILLQDELSQEDLREFENASIRSARPPLQHQNVPFLGVSLRSLLSKT